MQLDLFLDSQEVVLANAAVEALLRRDTVQASEAVDTLALQGPDYPALPALRLLAAALEAWGETAREAAGIAERVEWLQRAVAPAAATALGAGAQPFLTAFYRDLAEIAHGLAYDPTHPHGHLAYLRLQSGDDRDAEAAALAIPHWTRHGELIRWVATARYRSGGLDAAREAIFLLALRAPMLVGTLVDELADPLLGSEWNAFAAACPWDSVPEDQLPSWFPAWYLVAHPGAADMYRGIALPDSPAAHAVELLLRLLDLEKRADVRALSALRARLREANAELFSLYMARRSVFHR